VAGAVRSGLSAIYCVVMAQGAEVAAVEPIVPLA
jgi:hypothetical protein